MIEETQALTFDDNTIIAFTNIVRNIIQNEIASYMRSHNIEFFVDLSVNSVSSDKYFATLIDLATKETYNNVPNYTGFVLNKGDIVRMYYGDGQQYIGLLLSCKERMPIYNEQIKALDTKIESKTQ